jgi:sporulation protein YabP
MNAEKRDFATNGQTLFLRDRAQLEIRGVSDVDRFDEESVVLSTVCGTLTVEGSELHIQVLNLEQGIVTLSGKVDALLYFDGKTSEKDEKRGFLGKLFG